MPEKTKQEEFELNNKLLTEKLNKFLADEGFENFTVKRFEITSNCETVTEDYCRKQGMKRKKVTVGGESKCYCVFNG